MVNEEQRSPAGPAATETAPAADGARKAGPPTRPRAATRSTAPPQAPDTARQPARRRERRPEMIQKRREERYRQYERQRRQWLYTRIGLAAAAVLVVGAVAFLVFEFVQERIDDQALDDVQDYSYEGGQHSPTPGQPVTYTEVPPAGGDHDQTWQNCGFYEAPIDNWHGVHSLEHGAVWITHRPDLPQDQIDELRDLAEDTSYILVSPYPDLPAPVVLSGWNHQLQLDSVDDDGFDAFIRRYRRSADVPEPNGVCVGGTSATAAV